MLIEEQIPLPIVIFTPYTQSFEPFAKYILKAYGSRKKNSIPNIITLQGGIGPSEQAQRLRTFRETPCIAIVSILYAQAFSLEPAHRSFFIGCDWDPDNNRQAEKRLLRMTTKQPVWAYYYTHPKTIYDRLLDILNFKQGVTNLTLSDPVGT